MANPADPAPDQPITRTALMSVPLPAAKNTSHVEARRIRLRPGTVAGLHVHNCPVVGNIVEGSVTYQIGPAEYLAASMQRVVVYAAAMPLSGKHGS
jgi:quercetin dioxygenase-like cupin family protein